MKSILPDWLYLHICKNYSLDEIQEIRIRQDKVIQLCYKNKFIDLNSNTGLYLSPIIATKELIEYVIQLATRQSLYAFDEQIRNGYIVTQNGLRIGICGTAVIEDNKITFIKNISSLNIRVAHEIRNCSSEVVKFIVKNSQVKNTLIVSPPGAGKTTMLRDIVKNLSDECGIENIMVIDEKFEIGGEGLNFNLGKNVDIMQGANKNFAFYNAIKVMNPNVVATDEIISKEDALGILFAVMSGVKVIATVHSNSIEELKEKDIFLELLKNKIFERVVVLSKRRGVGTLEMIYDENLNPLLLPYLR